MSQPLKELFAQHKGKVSDKWERYLNRYESLFFPRQDQPIRLVELGVQNGGSLEIWAKYFANAKEITGYDIHPDVAKLTFDDPRIRAFVCDATTPAAPAARGVDAESIDILIDDGSHRAADIIKSFLIFFPLLSCRGIYVVEDIQCSYYPEFNGGLSATWTPMSFFKRIADAINVEHWDVEHSPRQLLQTYLEHVGHEFTDLAWLDTVASIEFSNSCIVICRAPALENRLGHELVTGVSETVAPGRLHVGGRLYTRSDFSGSPIAPWSDPAEVALPKLEALSKQLRERQAELVRELETSRAELTKLQAESSALKASNAQLTSSLSWRITMPLRRLRAAHLRAIRALSRKTPKSLRALSRTRHVLALQPIQHLEPTETAGVWKSTGNDPFFHVECNSSRMPSGWVRIRLRTSGLSETRLTPSLYCDTGQGFSESDRIHIPWRAEDAHTSFVRLPDTVRALRFDPLECSGQFSLSQIEIQEISKVELLFSLLGRQLLASPSKDQNGPGIWHAVVATASGRSSLAELKQRLVTTSMSSSVFGQYQEYVAAEQQALAAAAPRMQEDIGTFKQRPQFAIAMPVYNTPVRWLRHALDSVIAQHYPHWELCICDDNSTQPHVAQILSEYAARDSRIRVVRRTENGHIARATNDAMALATAPYLCLMDHDDEIPAHALYEFARVLSEAPDVDFIYSDEDKLTEDGIRFDPFFKPDWSPETLESCMYTAHFACYDKRIVDKIGGFRPECNGAQDYDFMLRYAEHVAKPRHVKKILYHWRAIPGSTAQSMSNKDYVIQAAIQALTERCKRTGTPARIAPGTFAGSFISRRAVRGEPLVSIIIPSAGRDSMVRGQKIDLLAHCIESIIAKSTYPNYEIIVVDNGDLTAETLACVAKFGVRRVTYGEKEFNVAAKMNLGAGQARGDYLLFLNDDIELITPQWLEAMVSSAQVSGVGMVGAKLRFEDGTLQHVGVTLSNGWPDHIRRGYPPNDPGYFFSSVTTRNVLAVTGACVLIERRLFNDIGRFDTAFAVNYNDIDLCLRVIEAGHRIVLNAEAELFHFESRNRKREVASRELDLWRERWGNKFPVDPYYGENFNMNPPRFELDFDRMMVRVSGAVE